MGLSNRRKEGRGTFLQLYCAYSTCRRVVIIVVEVLSQLVYFIRLH